MSIETDNPDTLPQYATNITKDYIIRKIHCIIIGLLIFGFLLFLMSLNFVAYNEYALIRNRLGTVYKDPVLKQGTYPLLPIYDITRFPATLIEVEFISAVFSDTGLQFTMNIMFYYRLPKENLYDIYNKFSLGFDSRIKSNSKKIIKNSAATFSVKEFLQDRTRIEQELAQRVHDDLLEQIGVIALPQYFKIIDIIFPTNIIANSLQSAIALQNNELQTNQQGVDVTIADTLQLVAEIFAQTDQIVANSVSESEMIINSADFEAEKIRNLARGQGIKNVVKDLQLSNKHINTFVDVMALYDNDNKTIFQHIDNVIVKS
jgi:hypothetical protein